MWPPRLRFASAIDMSIGLYGLPEPVCTGRNGSLRRLSATACSAPLASTTSATTNGPAGVTSTVFVPKAPGTMSPKRMPATRATEPRLEGVGSQVGPGRPRAQCHRNGDAQAGAMSRRRRTRRERQVGRSQPPGRRQSGSKRAWKNRR